VAHSVDLVVVGAGIAGASTACFAARAGLRVVVGRPRSTAGDASGRIVLTGGNGKGFKFGPAMGRALAEVIGGADFAASPLAPFAVDRDTRGQVIRGAHEYEWGSFA
jgi:glycine/D-amino acid oxidase-like deaminating enzyme